ncbi:MAG: hypothetical protein ACTSSJ_02300 [Candidatus Odinarchaeia archaeon]
MRKTSIAIREFKKLAEELTIREIKGFLEFCGVSGKELREEAEKCSNAGALLVKYKEKLSDRDVEKLKMLSEIKDELDKIKWQLFKLRDTNSNAYFLTDYNTDVEKPKDAEEIKNSGLEIKLVSQLSKNIFLIKLIKYKNAAHSSHLWGILDTKNSILALGYYRSKRSLDSLIKHLSKNGITLDPLIIPSFILQKVAKGYKKLKRIVLNCNSEVTGIKGISRVVLEGQSLLNSIEEIKERHEVDLRRIGALSEIETDKVKVTGSGMLTVRELQDCADLLKLIGSHT